VPRLERRRPAWLRQIGVGLAFLLVWASLALPSKLHDADLLRLIHFPVEGICIVAITLPMTARLRRVTSIIIGVALALLVLLKVVNIGFFTYLNRPFDPLNDFGYLGPAVGVLQASIGPTATTFWVVAAVVAAAALLFVLPLSLLTVTRVLARRRRISAASLAALAALWIAAASLGLRLDPHAPVASSASAKLIYRQVSQIRSDLADRPIFARAIAADRFSKVPSSQLLTGLRGKDVVLAFVESYGRIAVQGSGFSPRIDALLAQGTRRLRRSGSVARSAFLTSPTFGGISWLAHSTFQSGLWVDTQQRYNQLLESHRLTLTRAFHRAGWRTVFDVPAISDGWPQGKSFYAFDKLYDERNTGYHGPRFGYAQIPDQYTLHEFQEQELDRAGRPPVMAEIDLVSSHKPWTPLPHMVPWHRIGDGSVYSRIREAALSTSADSPSVSGIRADYAQSVRYSLHALISYVGHYADGNTVIIVLGDHQPETEVTGATRDHAVPVTIISKDPNVFQRISAWDWTHGLKPSSTAPTWPMSSFRDRFLSAFGPEQRTR
jgi:hypothetical protein